MCDKIFLIDKYFKRFDEGITRADELLSDQRYLREGILVLSCYLGAFAALRYNGLKDGEAYVNIVLEYSGKRSFFEQIDLLFFYQWPRSSLKQNGNYKELKQHSKIVEVLKQKYGDEEFVKGNTRYISPDDFITHIKSSAIPYFDENNLCNKLHLFSLAELLYRYLRCYAVHNFEFPFINEGLDSNLNLTVQYNNILTDKVLLETTRSIMEALRKQCLEQAKFPDEL